MSQIWRRHCNTLQHSATHRNALQHTATHCNTLQYTATLCNTLQHSATQSHARVMSQMWRRHCNPLQHTATHRNTLQHTAAQSHARVMSQMFRRHSCSCLCLSRQCNAVSYIYQKSCRTYEGIRSHILRSHVRDIQETLLQLSVSISSIPCCTIYKGVMSHIWRSQVTGVKKSRHRYAGDTAKLCNTLQHTAAHCSTLQHRVMQESCHRCEGDTTLPLLSVSISLVIYIRKTCRAYEGVRSHILSSHVADIKETLQHSATLCNTLQHTASEVTHIK